MEKWSEVFAGKIPEGNYQTKLSNGEENGLVLELENKKNHIIIDFGNVVAVRMLDEGIVQEGLYFEDEIKKYKQGNFKNIIYEVTGGEFGKQVQGFAGEYWETMDVRHYVIITQNYNIDIITEWEPRIEASGQKFL